MNRIQTILIAAAASTALVATIFVVRNFIPTPASVNAQVPAATPSAAAPFNITLKDIRMGAGPADARALLASASGQEGEFGVGADVFGSATVNAIFSDHVVLLRNGTPYVLWLARQTQPLTAASAPGEPEEDGTYLGAKVLDLIFALHYEPVHENGRFRGMQVQAPTPESQVGLRNAGMLDGDLIKSVNGVALTDADQFAGSIHELQASGRLTFGIERYGEQIALTFNLRE